MLVRGCRREGSEKITEERVGLEGGEYLKDKSKAFIFVPKTSFDYPTLFLLGEEER